MNSINTVNHHDWKRDISAVLVSAFEVTIKKNILGLGKKQKATKKNNFNEIV